MRKVLSRIYGRVMDTRNVLYDFGIFRSYRIGVPVISVGNITVGGTGKTPLAILIARLLGEMGERPAIVSRGYRRKDEKSLVVVSDGSKVIEETEVTGDEPLEMALALRGTAPVVCDANRVRGASYAVEKLGATVIVLDDAFQHRKIRRDFDIAVIDATDPFGSGRTLPAGRLRERVHNLSRADAIVLTRMDQSDDPEAVASALRAAAPKAGVFRSSFRTTAITPKHGDSSPEGRKFFLFCGIGNPDSLLRQLASDGLDIRGSRTFRDHHNYTSGEIDELSRAAEAAGADALLTTRKDAVKLKNETTLPCFVVESGLFLENEQEFVDLLKSTLRKNDQMPEPESP